MANYPKELTDLLQQYLTDGLITEKERAVLLRKAENLGVDKEEFDLYIDAEEQKIEQETDAAARKLKGKSCPYCGGNVPQLAEKCPHCDGSLTIEASKELQDIFDNLEEALVDMKSGNDFIRNRAEVERYSRKAKMYYGNNPKIQKLLKEVEMEMISAEKKAKSQERYNNAKVFFTNPWTYGGLFIILTILVIVFFIYKTAETAEKEGSESAIWWGFGIFYIGVPCIIGTISYIKKVCIKKN